MDSNLLSLPTRQGPIERIHYKVFTEYLNGLYQTLENKDILEGVSLAKKWLENRSSLSVQKVPGLDMRPCDVKTDMLEIYLFALTETLLTLNTRVIDVNRLQDIQISIKSMKEYLSNFDMQQDDFTYPYDVTLFSDFENILQELTRNNNYRLTDIPTKLWVKFRIPVAEIPNISPDIATILELPAPAILEKRHSLEWLSTPQSMFLSEYLSLYSEYRNKESYSLSNNLSEQYISKVIDFTENQLVWEDNFINNITAILDSFYLWLERNIPNNLSVEEKNRYVFNKAEKFNTILFSSVLSDKNHSNTLHTSPKWCETIQELFPEIHWWVWWEVISIKKRA